MNMLIRLIFLFMLFLTSQSGIATTTKLVNHQYDVNHISQGEGIYGYDTSSNHRNSHLNLTSVKVQGRSFLAFISDLLATKYSPINLGPLANDVAKTFRSATYTQRTLSKDTTLYRVISDNGNPTGSYWTSVKPKGPLQSVIDSALDQNWGNTATRVVTAKVPAGTKIYEGAAAAQRGLVGGGNQIYIPKVNQNWIQ